jgi:hypothetical protein
MPYFININRFGGFGHIYFSYLSLYLYSFPPSQRELAQAYYLILSQYLRIRIWKFDTQRHILKVGYGRQMLCREFKSCTSFLIVANKYYLIKCIYYFHSLTIKKYFVQIKLSSGTLFAGAHTRYSKMLWIKVTCCLLCACSNNRMCA